MSASNSYYKLIRLRLEKSKQSLLNETSIDYIQSEMNVSNIILHSNMLDSEKSNLSSTQSINKADQLKKWHKFVLQSYFSKIAHIKPSSKKYYLQIILEFIRFSPEIDPEDISNFMNYKFKLINQNFEFKIPYSKTQTKYANEIRRFVQNIYSIDPLRIKCEYYKNQSKITKEFPPKLSYKDIFEMYSALISNGK